MEDSKDNQASDDLDQLHQQMTTSLQQQTQYLQSQEQLSCLLAELKQKDQIELDHWQTLQGHLSIKAKQKNSQKEQKLISTDLQMFLANQVSNNLPNIELISMISLVPSQKAISDPLDIGIDLFSLTNNDLSQMSVTILNTHSPSLPSSLLINLVTRISSEYNIVPYHNFTHAFSVFQLTACALSQPSLKLFQGLEAFSALIAALAHDIQHKGVNNAYHNQKVSKKCVIYSGQSVLENMHSSKFFQLMQDKDISILSHLDKKDANTFKGILVSSILSTDMSFHNDITKKFTQMVKCAKILKEKDLDEELKTVVGDQAMDLEDSTKRSFCMNTLVHAADIGNPALEFDRYINWSYLVCQEFQDQTIKEAKLGLEVTAMFQYKGKEAFYGGQIFFCSTFVLPLWKQIGLYFNDLQFISQNIEKNISILKQKFQELKQ